MFRTLGERTSVRVAERDRRRRVYRSVADGFTIPAARVEERSGSHGQTGCQETRFPVQDRCAAIVGDNQPGYLWLADGLLCQL